MSHAKFSPSSSVRWLACPASVELTKDFPNTSSPYAEEGTAAHDLAEKALKERRDAADYIGQTFNNHEVDEQMANYVQQYVDFVRAIADSSDDAVMLIEQRVDFSPWVEDGFGTADAIVIIGDHMHVIDLKYGQGERVVADNNTQGMLYALGAYYELHGVIGDINHVTIHIVQPRVQNFTTWATTVNDLLKFGRHAHRRQLAAYDENPEFGPSEKACRWCKLSGQCTAQANHVTQVIADGFTNLDNITPTEPKTLTPEKIAELIPQLPMVAKWIKAVEEVAMEKILQGDNIPGFKAVHGRSQRRWKDEAEAEEFLKTKLTVDELYTKKMITAPQAEKVFKSLGMPFDMVEDKLIIKPLGKPALVPESDKRPAIGPVVDDFDELG